MGERRKGRVRERWKEGREGEGERRGEREGRKGTEMETEITGCIHITTCDFTCGTGTRVSV